LPKVIWEEGRVAALSHTYALKSPLVKMARPKFAPKILLPVDRSPNPTTCLINGTVRPMMPNGIRIPSAVFHNALDRQTDRPTDRSRESLMTIGRCAPRATRPNNNNNNNNNNKLIIISLCYRKTQLVSCDDHAVTDEVATVFCFVCALPT